MTQTGWEVFLKGKLIDIVFFDSDMNKESVKQSLIRHDGYDPRINVFKEIK